MDKRGKPVIFARNIDIPLTQSKSESKTTQTELNLNMGSIHRYESNSSLRNKCNRYNFGTALATCGVHDCGPLFYPNYYALPQVMCCHEFSRGMYQFYASWYPFVVCSNGYMPTSIFSPTLRPSPTLSYCVRQVNDHEQSEKSKTTNINSDQSLADKSKIANYSAGKPLSYYKIVNERRVDNNKEPRILKKLKQAFLKTKRYEATYEGCSTSDTRLLLDNEPHELLHAQKSSPSVNSGASKTSFNGLGIIEDDIDSYKSENDNDQVKPENGPENNTYEEQMEVTRNIRRLANILCDFNARCQDPRNQYYSDVIRDCIEKALYDDSENEPVHLPKEENRLVGTLALPSIPYATDSSDMFSVTKDEIVQPERLDSTSVTCIKLDKPVNSNTNVPCEKSNSSHSEQSIFSNNSDQSNSDKQNNLEKSENNVKISTLTDPEWMHTSTNTSQPPCDCGYKFDVKSIHKIDSVSLTRLSNTSTYTCGTNNSLYSSRPQSSCDITYESEEEKIEVADNKDNTSPKNSMSSHDSEQSIKSGTFDFVDDDGVTRQQSQHCLLDNGNLGYETPVRFGGSKTIFDISKAQSPSSDTFYSSDLQYRPLPEYENKYITNFNQMCNTNDCGTTLSGSNSDYNFSYTNSTSEYNDETDEKQEPTKEDQLLNDSSNTINKNENKKFENITAHFIVPTGNNTTADPSPDSSSKNFTQIKFSVNYDPNNPEMISIGTTQDGQTLTESTVNLGSCVKSNEEASDLLSSIQTIMSNAVSNKGHMNGTRRGSQQHNNCVQPESENANDHLFSSIQNILATNFFTQDTE